MFTFRIFLAGSFYDHIFTGKKNSRRTIASTKGLIIGICCILIRGKFFIYNFMNIHAVMEENERAKK